MMRIDCLRLDVRRLIGLVEQTAEEAKKTMNPFEKAKLAEKAVGHSIELAKVQQELIEEIIFRVQGGA